MHDIYPEVTRQILRWFGEVEDEAETWRCDRVSVVKEIGLGILRSHVHEPIKEEELLALWKKAVGDKFEDCVQLNLLKVQLVLFLPSFRGPEHL